MLDPDYIQGDKYKEYERQALVLIDTRGIETRVGDSPQHPSNSTYDNMRNSEMIFGAFSLPARTEEIRNNVSFLYDVHGLQDRQGYHKYILIVDNSDSGSQYGSLYTTRSIAYIHSYIASKSLRIHLLFFEPLTRLKGFKQKEDQ